MDVLTGRFTPSGKLPFALASSARAIMEQAPDAPGYDPEDTLFPFGHELSDPCEAGPPMCRGVLRNSRRSVVPRAGSWA